MSRTFLTNINLGQNQLENARIQNLAAAPSSPVKGQIYFNDTNNTLFWYDGGGWISAVGGAGAFPGYGASTAVTTFGATKADGSSTTVARADHTHGSPAHDAAAHSAIPLSALAVPTVDVPWNTKKITGLADGTAAADAVNKQQLDTAIQGLDAKQSVRLATTANVGLTGLAAIDGITPVANDRILVKNQTTTAQNGIYVAASGAWTRATDMDTWAEVSSAYTWVELGSTNADTGWVCTTPSAGTIGTTPITWTQFSGAGQISAGAGLTKTGSQLDVGAGTGISVAVDSVAVDTGVIATVASLASYVPTTRTITPTAPLTGGGDLSANRTLDISTFTTTLKGAVPPPTTATGKFLKDDGTWAAPPAAGGTVNKYSSALVGGATSQVITHGLNTRDVTVEVYRNTTPWDTVECDVERTTTTTCTLRFAVAPAANAYSVVVTG